VTITIGKCKIEVTSRGCTKCGTEWSHAWATQRTIPVTVGKRQFNIDVLICGDCMPNAHAPAALLPTCSEATA
jgi:hypothetical protein